MHGPVGLENPSFSVILIAVAFLLLYKSLITAKHYRHHQHSDHIGQEKEVLGHKIIDTNKGWMFFTGFITLAAIDLTT